jgi:hypothetical protein
MAGMRFRRENRIPPSSGVPAKVGWEPLQRRSKVGEAQRRGLAPVSGGDESGPVEGMGAQAFRALPVQQRQAGLVYRVSRG